MELIESDKKEFTLKLEKRETLLLISSLLKNLINENDICTLYKNGKGFSSFNFIINPDITKVKSMKITPIIEPLTLLTLNEINRRLNQRKKQLKRNTFKNK